MDSSDPFIAWLATGRRLAPGVLDTAALRRLPGRFQRCALRSDLLDRLLQRLAISEDARGQSLIWRMPRQDAGGTEDSLPIAPGHLVSDLASHTTTSRASAAPSAVPVVRAAATTVVDSSAPQSRSVASVAAVSNGAVEAGVSNTMPFVSRHIESERGLATSAGERTSTAAEINGKWTDASATDKVLSATGAAPTVAVPGISPRPSAVVARESESIVLRKHAVPSAEPSAAPTADSQRHAQPSLSTRSAHGSTDRVGLILGPHTRPVVTHFAEDAFEPSLSTAGRSHQVQTTLASTVESAPGPRALKALVLHKPTVNSAQTPPAIASAERIFPSAPSDARLIPTSAIAAGHRDRRAEAANERDDVDLLMERLVSDLELEARRRGHFRWR